MKNMCAYITDQFDAAHNIIAANEGAAVGLAAGHYLATGQPACVYMQNSGEGNIINPLASLTDQEVYNIPVLLILRRMQAMALFRGHKSTKKFAEKSHFA